MAATEANAATVVQEDGKGPETKPTEAEQAAKNANANSETVNSEVVDKDGTAVNSEVVDKDGAAVSSEVVDKDGAAVNSEVVDKDGAAVNSEVVDKDGAAVNSEVVDNKETVNNDTAAAVGAQEGGAAASGEAEPPQSSEKSSAEPKPSLLDSFLNKSGLGKVMGGRKKKEHSTATGGGGEENEGEKAGEEAPAAEGAEGGAEGEAAIEKAPESNEKEEEKKAEKSKPAESKSTVRDLIRKPVARIFSHRSTEKKDGTTAEPQKQVSVRSKSLDRLEDPEALNTTADSTIEEGGGGGGAEGEQKPSSSSVTTKHMKRWHSFKKLMAQKAHKKSGGGGEEGREEGADGEGGGRDSSTLDSKDSGQKRWKLKRSWTFQGLKRDPSIVGISGKTKGSDKDTGDKPEEAEGGEEAKAEGGAEAKAEGGAEAKAEGGAVETKTEEGGEKEKAEGGEGDKAPTAGGGTVTQHANEIWTSFKKRVISKSKRANTECAPSGEEDATAAGASGEDGVEEVKDGKSAKAKRSHLGRAVSLKNFIMRKGKSTSVDLGEGAKEEEQATEGEGGKAGGADGEVATAAEETNDKEAAAGEKTGEAKEPEKTPADAPVTNGENSCSNGTMEEHVAHNHQEEKTLGDSPVKKTKEAGVKEEANAKIINAMAAVNSDKKAGNV